MSTLIPGQRVLVDRSLKAVFVRAIEGGNAIIRIGEDTRITSLLTLSEEEA